MKPQKKRIVQDKVEVAKKQVDVRNVKIRRKCSSVKKLAEIEKKKQMLLEKKREREKKRRELIKSDSAKHEASKRAERARWFRRKSEGKIKSIDQLTPKEQREKRERGRAAWTAWYQKKKRQQEQEQLLSKQSLTGKARVQRANRKCYKENSRLKNENASLRRELEKFKKREQRRISSEKKKKKDSPRKIVESMLKNKPAVSSKVRESLLFGEILKKQLRDMYTETSSLREKGVLSHILTGKILRKYRKLDYVRKQVAPIVSSRILEDSSVIHYSRSRAGINGEVKRLVEKYFIENSRECPGKKDCLSKKGQVMQKRYLNSTMEELHRSFCLAHQHNSKKPLSYSAFARLRPFYVVAPKVSSRDTCLCLTHENMTLLVEALHRNRVIGESSTDKVVNSITCVKRTEECLARSCMACCHNKINYIDSKNEVETIKYQKWFAKKEERISGKTKKPITVQITVKETQEIKIGEAKKIFEDSLDLFMQHIHRIVHQYRATKECKANLTAADLFILQDFSQNYNCKYGKEPQSVHFGASKPQVTLHTGMVYSGDNFHQGFATLSPSLQHDPLAISAHLTNILRHYLDKFPAVKYLHFLSDGPTTQYRNKKMFYLLTNYITQLFPLIQTITYNYSEAGHGKSEADGTGGTIKRTADLRVALGNDVHSFEMLLEVLQKHCQKIYISSVLEEEIAAVEPHLPPDLPSLAGTMKVHQFKWDRRNPSVINFNSLSCYNCDIDKQCTHFHIGQIDYSKKTKPKERQLKQSNNKQPEKQQQVVVNRKEKEPKKTRKLGHHTKQASKQTRQSRRSKKGNYYLLYYIL